jgi:pyruvate formate lyase activating enzyme
MKGYLHSVETFGTVDGPGIRYVAFLPGCPLRCAYCHNPDSWQFNTNRQIEAGELVADVLRYRSFLGGLTLSGGEPLAQPAFTAEVLRLAKAEGLHTAIDTSAPSRWTTAGRRWMWRISSCWISSTSIRRRAGRSRDRTTQKHLRCWNTAKGGKPVWVRHVVVPGLSDDWDALERWPAIFQDSPGVSGLKSCHSTRWGSSSGRRLGLPYRLRMYSRRIRIA